MFQCKEPFLNYICVSFCLIVIKKSYVSWYIFDVLILFLIYIKTYVAYNLHLFLYSIKFKSTTMKIQHKSPVTYIYIFLCWLLIWQFTLFIKTSHVGMRSYTKKLEHVIFSVRCRIRIYRKLPCPVF